MANSVLLDSLVLDSVLSFPWDDPKRGYIVPHHGGLLSLMGLQVDDQRSPTRRDTRKLFAELTNRLHANRVMLR